MKSNLKRITIGVISFAIIAMIGFSYHDAEAEKCDNLNLDSKFERVENKNQIKITANENGNVKGVLSFTHIKDGNTSLVAKINCPDTSYDVTNSKTVEIEIPKGQSCTVDYNNTETGFSLDTILAIVEKNISGCEYTKSICEKVNEDNNEDIYNICQNTQKDYIKNSPYLMHFEYEIGSKKTDKVRNTSRDAGGVCYKFINSDKEFFTKELELKEEVYNQYSPSKVGTSAYASTLTYCYDPSQEYVDAEISDKQLISTMKLAVKTQMLNSISSKTITIVGDEYNLTNGTKDFAKYFIDNTKEGGTDNSLKCDPYVLEQHDKTKTDEQNYYVNNRTYSAYSVKIESATKEETGSYSYQCKKTCKEKITVSYGPPVGRIAGMCFEYKVKVKSIVDCGTEFTGQPPTMPKPTVCNYTPWCVKAHTTVANQAGPNEEFDACVIDCDGGKYTDKCTKKCYKKVYSNSTRKLSLFYGNSIIAKEMANSSLIDESSKCYGKYASILGRDLSGICNKNDATKLKGDGSACDTAIKDIVNLKGNYGEYINKNGKIVWEPSKGEGYDYTGCHWAKYSPFYFTYNSNTWSGWYEPERTVTGDSTVGIRNTWIDGTKKYAPDREGFKRKKNEGGCNEYCHYEQNGTCSGTNKDYETAVEKYTTDLKAYEGKMTDCAAAVTCTTTTAEFTIKVNNKLKGKNEDNWIDYGVIGLTPNLNKESATESTSKVGLDFILDRNSSYDGEAEKNGTCYSDAIKKQNTYLTEWSFPGTWINQKTGEISYVKPTNEAAWKNNKDKFCTSLDSAEVNKVWWNYVWLKYKAGESTQSLNEDNQKAIMSDLEYNIFATARNFGYFSWNFDFKCFYSYSNDEPSEDCSGEDCSTPSKPDDPTPTPDTYINRSIELTDNFPKEETSNLADASKVGREQGYNWKLEASNVKNKDYEVLPSALTYAIQLRGYKIYDESNSDKYKDYEFLLDKESMKNIRDYNKELKYNYKKFGTTSSDGITPKNGITCYKSSLIRSDKIKSTIDISTYNAELCVNNYKEDGNDETNVNSIANRNEYIQGLRALMQGGER